MLNIRYDSRVANSKIISILFANGHNDAKLNKNHIVLEYNDYSIAYVGNAKWILYAYGLFLCEFGFSLQGFNISNATIQDLAQYMLDNWDDLSFIDENGYADWILDIKDFDEIDELLEKLSMLCN